MASDTRAKLSEQSGRFPVVGIGASAGGLEACIEFLGALPGDTGLGFVLVQHLEPHHESHLAEILSRSTSMPVVQALEGARVEPDHVYVVPPNVTMAIQGGVLRLSSREQSANQYHPIDQFLRSLAEDMKDSAVGIILSGSASDGAQGLRAIKCAGGATFAQTEQSARHGGMPHAAIATGAVDFILPPYAIAAELARINRHPLLGRNPDDRGEAPERAIDLGEDQKNFQKIFTLLRGAKKIDFSQYKPSTLHRRIHRRMMIRNVVTLSQYVDLLESHPSEVDDLYRDILISVTRFFREHAMYEALARIESDLIQSRDSNAPFRIWTAGCATGEEAYSMAIVMAEVFEAAGRSTPIHLFGTDISEIAIERARSGVYSDLIQQEVSTERLRKYFTRVEAGYRISKSIRECCVFARHDLTRDAPFSQIDLVTCRNLLIYLGSPAQQRILPALHYSVKPEGLLILGSAESIGSSSDLFAPLDADNKIFSRKPAPSRFTVTFPDPSGNEDRPLDRRIKELIPAQSVMDIDLRAARILRGLYAPPGVTINDSMQIVHFHGHTAPYLESPSGEASLNLLRVADQSLLFPLRKTIDAAADRKEVVYDSSVRFERNGDVREIGLRVIPVFEAGARFFLILFESGAGQPSLPGSLPADADTYEFQLAQARRELDENREYLRRVIEQHEIAIEELRAAHEELQSSNEEMQSTNEELRTAKEELQSANEELVTVNDELNNRNNELGGVNNDLSNVLNAASIPIVMVGMDLRVRRYTPAAERLLRTSPGDIGRMITDIRYTVDVPGLRQMLADAIQTLAVQQCKVQNRGGRWFSVQVRPYRTIDDRIDGAVISFIDIDELTRALERAESARDFAEGIVETVQHPLLVLDRELRIHRGTSAFYKDFQVTREEMQGRSIFEIGNGQWHHPELRKLLEGALLRDVPFSDLDVEYEFPNIGRRTMRLNARRINGHDHNPSALLLAIEDVTDRKEAAEIQYRRLFESAKEGIVVIDADSGQVIDVNPYFLELTRFPRTDIVGQAFWEIPPFRKAEEGRRLVLESREREITRFESVRLQAQDGRQPIVDMIANRYRVKERTLIQVNIRDVTERRQAEEDLRRSNLDLQQFAFAASHDLQEPLRTVINQVQLLQREYAGKLDSDADEIITFITSATERMRQMVLDLVSYSQTARAAVAIVPVNMEVILATAMSNLQLAIQNTGARIDFDPLPVLHMDQTQLLQLLQNLIGNALKYRSAEPPRIHLSATQEGSQWVIGVQDNGLGIDPKFHQHVFTVFKRLHGPEYPGTGIGLATCKRIMERHGGRIWVESNPRLGSTFFFSVPIPPVDD